MSKKDKIKNIDMDDLKALPDVLDGRHHVIPIVTGGDEVLEEVNVPEILPILTLRSSVCFPERSRRLRSAERRASGWCAK